MSVAKSITMPATASIANIHPSLKITQQMYDCDRDNIIFLLTDIEGNAFEKTAGEIALSASMIAALPPQDILLVGYVAGMEHADFNQVH